MSPAIIDNGFWRRANVQDMKFLLSLIVIAVTLSVEVPTAFCDDQIEWELKQPFRFFKYRSDFEIHRWALEFLKAQKPNVEPSVLDIEHVLSDPDWWSKPLPISITGRFTNPQQQPRKTF
jgi:hypothetical protein